MSTFDLPSRAAFGRYTIERRLGGGRLSAVYQARDRDRGRIVALKILSPALASNPDELARWHTRARLAARLCHPHIVAILEIGEAEGLPYLAMAYIEGRSLREVLRAEGKLSLPKVAMLAGQLADALDYAHRQGVIHGHIQPADILIAERGQVFLGGFDLVPGVSDAGLVGVRAHDYCAPEQAEGRPVIGVATDIYAFGVMLYEALSGALPFDGDTPQARLAARLVHSPRPLGEMRRDLPEAVEEGIMRALARDPQARYASAGDLAAALREATGGLVAPPLSATPRLQDLAAALREPAGEPRQVQAPAPPGVRVPRRPPGPGGFKASTPDLINPPRLPAPARPSGPPSTLPQARSPVPDITWRSDTRFTGTPNSRLGGPGFPAREAGRIGRTQPAFQERPRPRLFDIFSRIRKRSGKPPRPKDTPVTAVQRALESTAGSSQQPRSETRERRIDAVMPRVVGMRRSVRLLVQVRLPGSRQLGPQDWPEATRPDLVERDARKVSLVFHPDPASGALQPLPLRIEASSDAFSVEPPAYEIEVPPDGASPLVKFRLTATRLGRAEVDVIVRTPPDGPILGTAYVATSIDEQPPSELLLGQPALSQASAQLFPTVVEAFAGLEIRIEERADGLFATLELDHVDGNTRSELPTAVPITIDDASLLALANDPEAYGRYLADQLFADQLMRDGWTTACQHASDARAALRVSLRIEGGDRLHKIYWELLCTPGDEQPLALCDRILISRYMPSRDTTPIALPRREELRAILAVANPQDLGAYGLAALDDVAAEIRGAREALDGLATTVLARAEGTDGRPTLTEIRQSLMSGAQVLYLVCHGTHPPGGEPVLWLEQDDGRSDKVRAPDLVKMIKGTRRRPLLVVLASCYSAGGGSDESLMAVGPRLASAGVPAVVGFQGQVTALTARRLLRPLFASLGAADGVVDQAMAVARYSLRAGNWWQAVLWLRTRNGRIWTLDGS